MDIGKELKKIRIAKGYTQEELSKKANISRKTLWNYENNKRVPDFIMILRIGKALGVNLSYLAVDVPEIPYSIIKDTEIKSEIINPVILPKSEQISQLNKFLAYLGYPYDISSEELNSLYDNLKKFLDFEFFKLGYAKVTDIEED